MSQWERQCEIAEQIFILSETQIMASLRFLSEATALMTFEPVEQNGLPATDGRKIFYSPEQIIALFRTGSGEMPHTLLHIFFHCLLAHPFQHQPKENKLWDFACDIAVEGAIDELSLSLCNIQQSKALRKEFQRLADYAGGTTAESFYNYFIAHTMSEEDYKRLHSFFVRDDHRLWYHKLLSLNRNGSAATTGAKSNSTANEDDDTIEPTILEKDIQKQSISDAVQDKIQKRWKQLARQAEADLKIFHKKQGKRAGTLLANLKPITFEQVDYSEFLRRFGSYSEVLHISEDEFDPIYYTYGLNVYGNVPLIEPLEFRDDARIREFVIAIDTSGSVQGEIVQDFLQKTCNVLRQTNTFASQVKIYLLQCDAVVQSTIEITNPDMLQDILPEMNLRGFGGTDFRPVFSAVKQLIEEKKLMNPNGLIYFTDGEGIYPEEEPPYKVAFIFNRDDYISPNVPSWAIRAVLTTENIKLLKGRN